MNIFRYQSGQEKLNAIRNLAAIGWFLLLASVLISIFPVTETQSLAGLAWSGGVLFQLTAGALWLKLKLGAR